MDSHLLKRVVGFDEEQKVEPLKINEMIMLTVGTANTIGVITSIKDGNVEVSLKYPVAASIGDRIAIGRRISNRWRLIGYGSIKIYKMISGLLQCILLLLYFSHDMDKTNAIGIIARCIINADIVPFINLSAMLQPVYSFC